MYEKKKRTIIRLIVLALVICGMIAVFRPIVLVPFGKVTIHYKTDGGIVSTQLEGKEAVKVWWMLIGKPLDLNLTAQGAACGFGPNRAITVGNTTFYVSQDDCGVLQKVNTNNLYRFTKGQWWLLWEIFEAHGADTCGH